MDPYRHAADEAENPRPRERPGWRDFLDVLAGVTVAIVVVFVILAIALFR